MGGGKTSIRTLEQQTGKGGIRVPKGGIETEAKHDDPSEFGRCCDAGARLSAGNAAVWDQKMAELKDKTNLEHAKGRETRNKRTTRAQQAVQKVVSEENGTEGLRGEKEGDKRRTDDAKGEKKHSIDAETSESITSTEQETTKESPSQSSSREENGSLKVYERRAIYPLTEQRTDKVEGDDPKEGKEENGRKSGALGREFRGPNSKKYSWIGRSLNRRSSISLSMKALPDGEKDGNLTRDSRAAKFPQKSSAATARKEEELARKAYLEEMNQYFAEVDAFELEAESPSPVVRRMRRSTLRGQFDSLSLQEQSHPLNESKSNRALPVDKRNADSKPGDTEVPGTIPRRTHSVRSSASLDHLALRELASINETSEPLTAGGVRGSQDLRKVPDGSVEESSCVSSDTQEFLHEVCEAPSTGRRSTLLPSPNHMRQGLEAVESPDAELSPYQQLLSICGQSSTLPTMDEFMSQWANIKHVKKIGEGTFGEAFKAKGVVFKIVPMEGNLKVNGEVQKNAADMLAEAAIATRLSKLHGKGGDSALSDQPKSRNYTQGIIKTHAVGVCQGRYPKSLVKQWKKWDKKHRSENDCVDIFPAGQKYVIFVVEDGGQDLEHFDVQSFDEARSLLLQVVLALAVAESDCRFEHRDLHWGNLLIRRDESSSGKAKLDNTLLEFNTSGLKVSLIDFTLSRLDIAGSGVAFCDLSTESWLFEGPKGDVQADTYRRMKKVTGGLWSGHFPQTNCLWLHYLADVLLYQKKVGMSSRERKLIKSFRKRVTHFNCAADAVWDELFSSSIIPV